MTYRPIITCCTATCTCLRESACPRVSACVHECVRGGEVMGGEKIKRERIETSEWGCFMCVCECVCVCVRERVCVCVLNNAAWKGRNGVMYYILLTNFLLRDKDNREMKMEKEREKERGEYEQRKRCEREKNWQRKESEEGTNGKEIENINHWEIKRERESLKEVERGSERERKRERVNERPCSMIQISLHVLILLITSFSSTTDDYNFFLISPLLILDHRCSKEFASKSF